MHRLVRPIWLLLAVATACATEQGKDSHHDLIVRVVNRNWADVHVYLARDGARASLGVVTTGRTATFTAPRDLVGGMFTLIGEPIGSRSVFTSEPFQAEPGRTVEWTIRVNPEHSSVLVE